MKYMVILRVDGKILKVWRCKTNGRTMRVKRCYEEMAKKYENAEIEVKEEEE